MGENFYVLSGPYLFVYSASQGLERFVSEIEMNLEKTVSESYRDEEEIVTARWKKDDHAKLWQKV